MAEVKECDRALAATGTWAGEEWRTVTHGRDMRDWVASVKAGYPWCNLHAEQYARQREEIEQLRERAEKAESAANSLTNQLSDAVARANGLEAELAKARKKMETIEAGTGRLYSSQLRARAESAETELARFIERLERTKAERDELRERAEKAEAECAEVRGDVATVLSNANSEIGRVIRERDKLRKERDELRDKLDRTLRELEELRVRLAATQGVADGTRKSLEDRTQELEKLRAKATPSGAAVRFALKAMNCPYSVEEIGAAIDFILSRVQKRKTRLDAAIEHECKQVGASKLTPCEEARIAGLLTAAGVPLDEEMPEAP